MIYLDTHVIVWMYQKDKSHFSQRALEIIDNEELIISPMVELELEFLYEIERIKIKAEIILDFLKERTGLKACDEPFKEIIQKSINIKWTRDPFDRIITAQASIKDSLLLTKNKLILKHYPKAVW